MTKEKLQEAIEIKARLDGWYNQKKNIITKHDAISMTFRDGICHGSFTLSAEETAVVVDALSSYYDSQIAICEKQFNEL